MDTRPSPNLAWRIFVLVGLGTLTTVSVNDRAWERFSQATGDTVPRSAIRRMVATTFGLHALESVVALLRARRLGLPNPGHWAAAAFLWGFPVLRRLGRAGRASDAATSDAATSDAATSGAVTSGAVTLADEPSAAA